LFALWLIRHTEHAHTKINNNNKKKKADSQRLLRNARSKDNNDNNNNNNKLLETKYKIKLKKKKVLYF